MLRNNSGFTLIEVMIAMGVAAILVLGVAEMIVLQNRNMANIVHKGGVAQLQGALRQAATSSLAINKSADL